MKYNTITLSTLFLALFVLFAGAATAQNERDSQKSGVMNFTEQNSSLTISEEDFRCFRELNCLKRNTMLREKGLNVNFSSHAPSDRYILKGESKNEKVYAEYNDKGDLVKGVLVRTDVILPSEIRNRLSSGEYKDWTMIGNEITITNFDSRNTEYKVIVQKEGEAKVLYFDRKGNENRGIAGL